MADLSVARTDRTEDGTHPTGRLRITAASRHNGAEARAYCFPYVLIAVGAANGLPGSVLFAKPPLANFTPTCCNGYLPLVGSKAGKPSVIFRGSRITWGRIDFLCPPLPRHWVYISAVVSAICACHMAGYHGVSIVTCHRISGIKYGNAIVRSHPRMGFNWFVPLVLRRSYRILEKTGFKESQGNCANNGSHRVPIT